MSEELDLEAVAALRKKRQFKKFTFRGLTLEDLLKLSREELAKVYLARARRRMQRGFKAKHNTLLKKLVKSKEGTLLFSFLWGRTSERGNCWSKSILFSRHRPT